VTLAVSTYGYPAWFLASSAFAVGAAIGSFLNVVIARVPYRESVVWPGSHCRACGTPIRARDNIPILSWFLRRGRCGECLAPFSIRYALVELGFALVCALAVARHGLSWPAAHEALLMAFLVVLTGTDLDHWLLPHEITWPGIAVGVLLAGAQGREPFLWHLFAAAAGYSALALVGFIGERLLQKEAIGGGDPWLFALIGAFLGLRALPAVLLLASVQGTVIGIAMVAARRRAEAHREVGPQSQKGPGADPPATAPTEAAARTPSPGLAESPPAPGAEEEEWTPEPTAIPFGPFLALGAAEILYFARLPHVLFPWPF
jgi:leader peptidase (prepilin peptidase)/N-methyltransferase